MEPGVPKLRMSPAQMFAHGVARAGYIEVPRDPLLALEFLETKWRTIQPYGVNIDSCVYDGDGLYKDGRPSPYKDPRQGSDKQNLWPFQIDPDDITRTYFRDMDRKWHVLHWTHAPSLKMPMSRDALAYGRKLAAKQYLHPNDPLIVADLLERWNLGFAQTPTERRMALRMARDQAAFDIDLDEETPVQDPELPQQDIGDDDYVDLENSEDFGGTFAEVDVDEEDFYADALADL